MLLANSPSSEDPAHQAAGLLRHPYAIGSALLSAAPYAASSSQAARVSSAWNIWRMISWSLIHTSDLYIS